METRLPAYKKFPFPILLLSKLIFVYLLVGLAFYTFLYITNPTPYLCPDPGGEAFREVPVKTDIVKSLNLSCKRIPFIQADIGMFILYWPFMIIKDLLSVL